MTCFIIAELGINHNGSLDTAKKLVDAAIWAGANAIKLQKRDISIVCAGQMDKPRESPWGKTYGEYKRAIEFGRAEYDEVDRYCKEVGIPWFASAWDIPSLDFLKPYNLPWNKVASAMATHESFIRAVKPEKKPVFLSTGMCDISQIAWAATELMEGGCEVTLMHTVSTYPAPESDLNLACIRTLRERFNLPVGYSGHEVSVSPSVVAVALGAVAVERHLTLDRSMYGTDQAASLEPHGFKSMVEQIRKIPAILGDGEKRITAGEEEVAKKLRYWL